ncbi:MAG: hypothetical protein JST79_17095 [Acidobacteria bacterium]|nr:hypothetical protein [Acidobacteriota bacterium]
MSGREAVRAPESPAAHPDHLEVAAGTARQQLEGWVPELASPEELRAALEQAFDYRGDVLITRKDGTTVEGYIFDRRSGASLEDSLVRLLPKNGGGKTSVRYAEIAALAFTGRDMAAGKSWENWVRQYWEKKAAGETNISIEPESLE